jgi:hypothetical protein
MAPVAAVDHGNPATSGFVASSRHYGWPRLGRPFYGGWVTWRGHNLSNSRWRFEEYTSGTVFEFTGYVL